MNSRQGRRVGRGLRVSAVAFATASGAALAWAIFAIPILATAGDRPASKSSTASQASVSAAGNFLDPLLEAAWKEAGVKPGKPASDEEFLRRAYLDVLGRIPSVQEARAFLSTREADKRGKLVEYLLNHVDFPKNFATQWTTLLVGRSPQGRMVDRAALTAWLRKQFAADRPWNEVVYDLVTASGSNRENGAVNFTLAHLESEAVPLTARTTRLFLGQQIQCVQCHDHPNNDWKQSDFWGINAFFRGVKTEDKNAPNAAGLEAYDHTELHDEPSNATARFEKRNGMMGVAFPTFLNGVKAGHGDGVIRRVELGKMITDPKSDLLPRAMANRMWAQFLGRGFVNPIDDIGPHNVPVNPEILDKLADAFRDSKYDVKQMIRWIMTSRAYQATSLRAGKGEVSKGGDRDDSVFNVMQLRPMSPEQLFDSLLTATSAHKTAGGRDDAKREAWMKQFLFAFGNDEGDEATSFQGTIPQSLMMMNGELMKDALSGKSGSFLADVLEQAQKQGRAPAPYMIDQIYLAALSRFPTAKERHAAMQYLDAFPDSLHVLQDLFWALLNSNEFILIH
ncbi:DUF1549 and DUF1553 domain-containing protein [Paludisphaera borealis]|uniref:DUF1549 domain-containing protein n=1 Tax=Paludisphaera borealis TaxID=1387353 RepID=A0A1U7CYJ1_9BACT|nr:DUF1549 and DUF1553 domain-containing protein [Paludisphaera borealis]APW64017.1 hypothetical protein BSF38_05606 [Paludisphaera borealis]